MKKLLPLAGILLLGVLALLALSLPVSAIRLPLVTPVPTNVDALELVTNGGFETADGWTLSRGSGRRVCPGGCEYRFTGVTGGSRLLQKIATDGAAFDRLVLSFFSRARNWKHSSYVHLKIIYADGTYSGMYTALNRELTMIRNESQIVTDRAYSKLKLTIVAGSLSGRLWVDDVSVTRNVP